MLVQLPPSLPVDFWARAQTLDSFPSGTRIAFEPRHESWWADDIRGLLAERGVALVWADRGGWPYGPLCRTASWGYLRLHYGDAHVPPNYHRHTLRAWAERIAAQYSDHEDFFVYSTTTGDARPSITP